MKQILQSLRTGTTQVADVPAPRASAGHLVIASTASLISAGTERMLVEFGKANWIDKARQQPDKVRMVVNKARTDGLVATLHTVRSKLDKPLALGYCNVGTVAEIGEHVTGFSVGDRVVSNGSHAEVVAVPLNLSARIPDGVSDEQATFTVVGAIGLQGIRLVNPSLGECVVVTGLGLIGLLTVQMLRAQGCRVLGVDFDATRLALAKQFGAEVVNPGAGEDVLAAASTFSRGRGVDAVIIAASTDSNEPVRQAANMCRKRGRIVLVGVTGLELSRADFYEKELSFQVSCSYGPGRYDTNYEQRGHDYPVGFVRWTEQRNFEAVLDLMVSGAMDVTPLISHRFALDRADAAYALLSSNEPSLGIIMQYPAASAPATEARDALLRRHVQLTPLAPSARAANIALVGAGNYAGHMLIPAFKAAGATLKTVVSAGGVSAVHLGKKYGFGNASTDETSVISDPATDTVVIATRHDAHARQVLAALAAGKHVFCEKPLCLTHDELHEIEAEAGCRPSQLLMVGFNRRFAPQIARMKSLLDVAREPKAFILTVNAGAIPPEHWTQDRRVGGGRIIGEACHFIDLLRYLADSPIVHQQATGAGGGAGAPPVDENVSVTLRFADGSVGTVHYFANGNKGFPKERLEVFCAGRVLQLDNFRKMRGWGWKGFSTMNLWQQDKGQTACAVAFVNAVKRGERPPIPAEELFEVSRVTMDVAASL